MNESTTQKLCPKHQVELVQGYCPQCYPFPRIHCIGCGQPLTSKMHRARKEGARCYQKRIRKERQRHMKEEIPYVDFGDPKRGVVRKKYRELGDLF